MLRVSVDVVSLELLPPQFSWVPWLTVHWLALLFDFCTCSSHFCHTSFSFHLSEWHQLSFSSFFVCVCVYSTVALSFLSTLFKLLSPSFFISYFTTWQWTGSLFYHVTVTSVRHHFRQLPFCFGSCTCSHLIPSHFPVFIVICWQLTMFPFVFFLYVYRWTSFAHRYSFCFIYW